MRVPAAVSLAVLVSSSLASGCSECWSTYVSTQCDIAGELAGTYADGTTYDNLAPGLAASCPSVSFGSRTLLGGGQATSVPQDLNVGMMFDARVTPAPAAGGGAVGVTLRLTVRRVPLGPSEIDLDDTRAALTGWSGLRGHLSITTLSQDCSHGDDYCLLDLQSVFTVTATGANGTLSLTDVSLAAHDTYSHEMVMCTGVVGE